MPFSNIPDAIEDIRAGRMVVLVDAESTDDTVAVAESYRGKLPRLTVLRRRCRRGPRT